ncbi:MAG: hypothetical protein NTX56_07565 [Proteobacteria bacterium]|nr:hypothetical protein [Pseudomonadota bacterium]
MDTPDDTPNLIPPVATAPTLPADDPRLTPEAIEFRRTNPLVERDDYGRLLPGSQLPGKGRKGGPLVTTLARQHTEAAIAVLARIVNDPKAPPAAQALLDRGWGKAPIQIDMQVKARFDDFLREVGIAAQLEMEQEIAGVTLDEEVE